MRVLPRWLVVIGIVATARFGVAQSPIPTAKGVTSYHPYEVSATYARMATDGSFGGPVGLNGFTASASAGVLPLVQATAEVGGYYAHGVSLTSFLAGPQVGIRFSRFQPFVRGLFGVSHTNISSRSLGNGFTVAAGGGLNVFLTDQIAIRALQVDYYRPYGGAYSSADFLRVGFGVSYQFGSR